jgi:hypothetical protein
MDFAQGEVTPIRNPDPGWIRRRQFDGTPWR